MNGKKPKVLDLFCGAGGLSWGFEKAGFTVQWGLDNWRAAVRTFQVNHPSAVVYEADITEVSDSTLKEWFGGAEVVVGGPPCQGFSTAGKRLLDDPRNKLVKEFLRAIKVLKPLAFVMENVEGFTSFAGGRLLQELTEEFEKLGYRLTHGVLDAVNYGVPQRRRRFFLLGIAGAKPLLPEPTHRSSAAVGNLWDYHLEAPLTFEDATSDLPLIGPGEKSEEYASSPRNEYQRKVRNGRSRLTLHEAPNHKPYMVELIKRIPQGKSAFEVADEIPKELMPSTGYPNSYKRIRLDEPAPTITRNFTTPSSANCIHPLAHRALTLREGARIQSFPDSYEFVGSFTAKRLLIGNAVPPLLSLAVARAVAKSLGVDERRPV